MNLQAIVAQIQASRAVSRGWLASVILAGVVGCSSSSNPAPGAKVMNLSFAGTATPIREAQNPQLQNKTVYLRGRVGHQAPILDGVVYELQDGTGSIWVRTTTPVPQPGSEVTVKGVLRFKSIPLVGQERGSVYVDQVTAGET